MYLTVTLNPALDKIVYLEQLKMGEINPIEIKESLAAGKGVDVTKVLRDLGHPVTACGFIGNNHAATFERLCITRSINDRFTRIKGQTRTNIHILDADGHETELMEPAPEISQREWKDFIERLGQVLEGCNMVAFCGSVPHSVTPQMLSEMFSLIERYNLPVLVDTHGSALDVALTKRPHLVKFNQEKIRKQLGKYNVTLDEVTAYAKGLIKIGVQNVLISLGKDGALLYNKDAILKADAPEVDVVSTIGCGDAMVASIAESLRHNRTPEEMLRHSVAISSANALTSENAKIDMDTYQALLEQVKVYPL